MGPVFRKFVCVVKFQVRSAHALKMGCDDPTDRCIYDSDEIAGERRNAGKPRARQTDPSASIASAASSLALP